MPIIKTPEGLEIEVFTLKPRYAIARRVVPAPSRVDEDGADTEIVGIWKDSPGGRAQWEQTLEFLRARHPREEYIGEDFQDTGDAAEVPPEADAVSG